MEATFGPTESFASLIMAMDFPEVPFAFLEKQLVRINICV